MTSALDAAFKECEARGRIAFVPYLTAGYPTKADTVQLMLALQKGGADVIELGMPFSDPLADGPTIQKSSFIALNNGVTLTDCFNYVKQARKEGLTIPVVLMGYYNPFIGYGEEKLVIDSKEATISGFIVVDMDRDDCASFSAICKKHGLSFIPLVAPTSTNDSLEELGQLASGYVYCVSLTGVTGERKELPEGLEEFLGRVKQYIKLPRAVGFGLSTHDHFLGISKLAEAAVMGSKVIKVITNGGDTTASRAASLESFTREVVTGSP